MARGGRLSTWVPVLLGALGAAACATDPQATTSTSGGGGAPATTGGGEGGSGAAMTSGGSGGAAGGTGGAGGDVIEDGTWQHPFLIPALPFTDSGDTSLALSDDADSYFPCAESTDESGGEVVYQVEVDDAGWLWARLDDVSGDGVDVDVHLLHEADPGTCVTRANVELGSPVRPGTYVIAVDTWVDGGGTPMPGAYTLEVGFVSDAGDDCYLSPIDCDNTLPPYVNGVPTEEPGAGGCPSGMARVADFCVDRYEAMLVEVLPDDSLAPWSPYQTPGDADVMALSVQGVRPQGHITQVQAEAACQRAGKRLCTNTEWLRACQGAQSSTYPYGNTRMPGVCNDARDCHPVIQTFETDEAWVWSMLDDPCISQLPEGLELTGSMMGCSAGEGVFDMMGNLHEWTSDPAGTFRGGFYMDTAINGEGCLYATTAHNIYHWDYSTGFRCCADAP